MIFLSKNEELLEASRIGDIEKVKKLLKKGADVNAKDNYGFTPLHDAAFFGRIEVVKLLIEKGANVNAKDNLGSTPLHLAAIIRRIEVVKLLIEKGANVNAKDNVGWTPLHWAAFAGHIEVVKLLIENGAYVNATDNDGFTPLHLAANNGHIEVVKLLLEHGADPNIKNYKGKTAIDLAREEGYFDIAKLIEEFISFQILSIESPKLYINEWGKIIVKVKGKGKVSINLEGDIEWIKPELKDLSGESTIEIPVKPKISGEVPVKIIIDSIYGKESSMMILKVEKKTLHGLDDIIPLRNMPLKNLVTGYGCDNPNRFKVNLSSPTVFKEFEGAWDCCLLGCGGWGCAYLATRGNEKIVIKIPRGHEAIIEGGIEGPTGSQALLKKIRSEAEIMGSLDHPNIIKLLGVSNKHALLIYEFADYGSLYWQLNKGWRPSLKDVVLIGIQLGDALRYIHSRGLIHGDIKPSNVFIKDKIAKLGDFSSMVKLLSSVSTTKMPFTFGFRAPEQAYPSIMKKAKELGIENRIDVYQLGNLLLYILTSKSIDGEEAKNEKLAMEKLSMVPNEELRSVLEEALKLEPDKRPSAEEFTKKLYNIWNKL
jgi:ankyrin repeat protein